MKVVKHPTKAGYLKVTPKVEEAIKLNYGVAGPGIGPGTRILDLIEPDYGNEAEAVFDIADARDLAVVLLEEINAIRQAAGLGPRTLAEFKLKLFHRGD